MPRVKQWSISDGRVEEACSLKALESDGNAVFNIACDYHFALWSRIRSSRLRILSGWPQSAIQGLVQA